MLPHCLPGFMVSEEKSVVIQNIVPPYVSFSSGCFHNFFLNLFFGSLIMMFKEAWFSLGLSCLGFMEFLDSIYLCLTKFGKFSAIISSKYFLNKSFSPFVALQWHRFRPFDIVLQVSEALFLFVCSVLFWSVSSIFCRLDNFYLSVFEFADFSFLCHLYSAIK